MTYCGCGGADFDKLVPETSSSDQAGTHAVVVAFDFSGIWVTRGSAAQPLIELINGALSPDFVCRRSLAHAAQHTDFNGVRFD